MPLPKGFRLVAPPGGEVSIGLDDGDWPARERGQWFFSSLPANANARFPINDPASWNFTGLDPTDTVVGLSVGTSNTFACQTSLSTETATLNSALSGVSRAAGTLCVHIYDPSDTGLPGPVTYKIQVTHF